MKIIEALKELPLIDKKLERNEALIREIAASVDAGTVANTLKYATAELQTAEVAALVQSSRDLVSRKAKLRRVLSLTNATLTVTIDGETKTICEWIEYRQKGTDRLRGMYGSLNDREAFSKLSQTKIDGTQGVKVVRHYDESQKNAALAMLLELPTKIDTTLETFNATTDLVQEVA